MTKEIRKQMRDFQRNLIASRVYKEEISDRVELGDSDYDLYYQAHKEEFIEPERIAISHIQLSDERCSEGCFRSFGEWRILRRFSQRTLIGFGYERKGGGTLANSERDRIISPAWVTNPPLPARLPNWISAR